MGMCSVHVDEAVLKRCRTSVDYTWMSVCKEDIFLETVPEKCHQKRVVKFIEATGCDVMKTLVCMVCAGCFFSKELCPLKLEELKDNRKLKPVSMHHIHDLTDRMLLYWNAGV